jgi:hypothetical protein
MRKVCGLSYVPALRQSYEYDAESGVMRFDDGVKYSVQEACILSGCKTTPQDIFAVHLTKKVFDGYIVGRSEGEGKRKPFKKPHPLRLSDRRIFTLE